MKTVSYSQFSLYAQCPYRWKLDYLEDRRKYEQNINTCFGSAFHHTVQEWVKTLFEVSAKAAESMDLNALLKESMTNEYRTSLEKNGNVHYSNPTELGEFYMDGVAILDYLKKNRATYFSNKGYELVGIEKPLRLNLMNNVAFMGFIDLIIKDKVRNKIIIYDIKTSTQGWNKYQKADLTKTAQLVLYKEFYARQFNMDVEDIEVEYIIVRRKINEDLEFKPKRVQTFVPASGKPTRNKVAKMLHEFVTTAFSPEGEYNTEADYPAVKSKACNYCPYKDKEDLCPKKSRITRDE